MRSTNRGQTTNTSPFFARIGTNARTSRIRVNTRTSRIRVSYRTYTDPYTTVPSEDRRRTRHPKRSKNEDLTNSTGYAQLILSMSGKAFSYVDDAKTTELPDGDLALVYERLQAEYAPTGRSDLVEVNCKTQFNNCALESTKTDPEEWFDKLEYLRKRLRTIGSDVTDDDLIAHMLAKMPYEYSELVTTTTSLLDYESQSTVTVANLKK